MSTPQLENGYVRIANEIMEALAKIPISSGNNQILYTILRKTYGFNKKEDRISISQLQKMTGLAKRTVIYCLQNLEAKKLIKIRRKKGRGHRNEVNIISFNKNHEEWVVQEKSNQYRKAIENRKLQYIKSKEMVVQEKFSGARNSNLVVQETEKKCEFLAHTIDTITKDNTKDIDIYIGKIKFMDFVYLTIEEYQKLVTRFGEEKTKRLIEQLNNGIGSKGYKYKSHYFTILSWERNNGKNAGRGKRKRTAKAQSVGENKEANTGHKAGSKFVGLAEKNYAEGTW